MNCKTMQKDAALQAAARILQEARREPRICGVAVGDAEEE
jgi:hypothetical protein